MSMSKHYRRIKANLATTRDVDTPYKLYICTTADIVLSKQAAAKVKIEIAALLGVHLTLDGWLVARGIQVDLTPNYRDKMQATRHAWLDHLIKYHESLGD